jgi:hypothetical protein
VNTAAVADKGNQLHPAEHRAYRELFVSARQLVGRWERLISALRGTPYAEVLERGRDRVESLLTALGPRTAAYGLHGGPASQGLGARIADVRGAITDRWVDTGMVMRLAVLDIEHVATLLGQLTELARAREDDELAAFCRQWQRTVTPDVKATRTTAIALGASPDRTAAPLDQSILGRTAHRVGWALGAVGETVDRFTPARLGGTREAEQTEGQAEQPVGQAREA